MTNPMTQPLQGMLETHPQAGQGNLDQQALLECLAACFECAQVCTSCADACLGEQNLDMLRRCIRLNLDCADVCDATGRVLTRCTQPDMNVVRTQLQACLAACEACGAECEQHAEHHQHCAICAESCRRCADACRNLLSGISA
ncbi:four-helix bundle copper-binding protein [Deinococcus peraridilitoris]|uniref:Four-helix bundle copper-binding protein n=1 Tax=Deinococcus peraridilitoris (strain DSM 19664 / LMG 22246 / CIP 109416 / KR-200) TaxID=937777 RepID=L0A2I1_DEIPD|nr:four-helix bundle copper-binding protein [Deinococcus peraridilitoris]AFZ67215.1 hypothetical protein Deipe_1687 [Deinococcus peraridilitoris DSM 19664]